MATCFKSDQPSFPTRWIREYVWKHVFLEFASPRNGLSSLENIHAMISSSSSHHSPLQWSWNTTLLHLYWLTRLTSTTIRRLSARLCYQVCWFYFERTHGVIMQWVALIKCIKAHIPRLEWKRTWKQATQSFDALASTSGLLLAAALHNTSSNQCAGTNSFRIRWLQELLYARSSSWRLLSQ